MTTVPIKTATGGTIYLSITTLADGSSAVTHVLVDGNGTPYSASHPLLTAPAIFAVAFTDRSGQVTTPNATILDIPADPNRKGGSFRAAPTNTGAITLTLRDASQNTTSELLEPGDTFSLTVNGYVIQNEILISGSTAGDGFSGRTFS